MTTELKPIHKELLAMAETLRDFKGRNDIPEQVQSVIDEIASAPSMPELPKREYIEAMQQALDDGFGLYCAYENLRKALSKES